MKEKILNNSKNNGQCNYGRQWRPVSNGINQKFIIAVIFLMSLVFFDTASALNIPSVGDGCAIETNRSSPCYGRCKSYCQTTKPTAPTTQTNPTTPQQPTQQQIQTQDQNQNKTGQLPTNPQYAPGDAGSQPGSGDSPGSVIYPSGTKQGTMKITSPKVAGKKTPVYSYRKIPTVKGKLLKPSQTRK